MANSIRSGLTAVQRATLLRHTIDPGFVNHRLADTVLGAQIVQMVNEQLKTLVGLPEWQKPMKTNWIYTQFLLVFCNKLGVRPLQEVLAIRRGRLFCSTERLLPCKDIYKVSRAVSVLAGRRSPRVEFHYSTAHIISDTLKSRLHDGDTFSIVGTVHSVDKDVVVLAPVVLGNPWLAEGDVSADFDIMWYGRDFFENFPEDFDELSRVTAAPLPATPEGMREVSEAAFKACLVKLLGGSEQKDWGGETSDFFSAHMHIQGRRASAAFLLKGPHHFKPMGLNHLGKNNDQIVRLSQEPADVLIVQHCHDIRPAVRSTLRAFAVQPSNPRRYCFIDGRDSLRILQAYGLYDHALQLSNPKPSRKLR
jgi:hypothetical protein